MNAPYVNLPAGWIGILCGMLSGMVIGLFFHRPDWLDGYGSFPRRLYRLAHISFFGLGVVNLFFHFTVQGLGRTSPALAVASWALMAGAAGMPLCCVLMAHLPRTRMLFALPVLALLTGAALTVCELINPQLLPDSL